VIIHIAAITHTNHAELYYQVNYEGTRQLLAVAHHSQHFVFISTRCIGEAGGAYSHSKYLAEQAIQNSGIPYTIIRPAEVYGSNPKEGIDFLIRIATRMRILIDFKWYSEITYSPISVQELVDFMVAVVWKKKHGNRIYTLCNNESYTAQQIAESLEARNFGHIYRFPISLKLILFLLKLHMPVPFKRDQIARLVMAKTTDNKLAREDYGFNPASFLDVI
jgi:NADH dehydrogenase